MNSPLFYILLYFGLQWIDEENLHWGGQSALLNPLMQMLISPRNTLIDIIRIIFIQTRKWHHSSIAWKIPWTEESGRLYSAWDCKEYDMT